MKTISELMQAVALSTKVELRLAYAHPLIYVFCVSDQFASNASDDRIDQLAGLIEIAVSELHGLVARGTLQVLPVTWQEYEQDFSFLHSSGGGRHWLEWYSRVATDVASEPSVSCDYPASPRVFHFYGLKGGQARSTVLLLTAKSLADQGLKILVVDADLEAPSLDAALGVAAEDPASTLMGLAGWADDFQPISRAYFGDSGQGQVDLLACRPRAETFDLDFASFLLSSTLDARMLESAARKLCAHSAEAGYHYVLVDHRTGLAPSVLPIVEGWPGPAVVFARPDGMSRNLESAVSALLGYDPSAPGAFVTFSLDPKETRASVLSRNGPFVERLLERLSDAIPGDVEIDPADLERNWILWCHDPSVIAQSSPRPDEILPRNREALAQLRDVLGLRVPEVPAPPPVLSKSGAGDEGAFILTPDFARLFSLDSGILYILGRKGTGKTRLLRELHQRGLGMPLLVAQDYKHGGVQSGLSVFNALWAAAKGAADVFWLALFRAGILTAGGVSGSLENEVKRAAGLNKDALEEYANLAAIEDEVRSMGSARHVFLIDGVETAVPAAKLREFVEGLFRFMASIQFNRAIAPSVSVRLFLRSDLYKAAAQNVEQQIEGRSLDLRWDRQAILNFALARLASLPWFQNAFSDVCNDINLYMPDIARGAVAEDVAEEILLRVFPDGLDRNRLKTSTFLATYFSDAGGESDARASFYPRLFDGFLRKIDVRARGMSEDRVKLNGRLSSPLVLESYDDAAKEFLDEVRSELQNLLYLDPDEEENLDAVHRLVDAFHGLKTPFVVDQLIEELSAKAEVPAERVRESLARMKRLGMFEDRPGFPGSWRTGRLYKSGLNMKYVRSKKE